MLGGAGALCLSNSIATGDPYQHLPAEVPDLTTPTFLSAVAKHGVEHHITTMGPPVYARAGPSDSAKLAIAREEFSTMECLGIVWRSNSPWLAPRGDFSCLNNATTPDRYPVPHIQDFTVTSFPRPCTVQSLQEFLDMVNFYNSFLQQVQIQHILQGTTGSFLCHQTL